MSHDLYARVQEGPASDAELRVSKITTLALSVLAIILGIAFEKENVAYMVMLAFVIACSGQLPVLFMSVLWKNCTTKGVVTGGFVGLALAVVLTIGSASIWEAVLKNPRVPPGSPPPPSSLDDRGLRDHLVGVDPRQLRSRPRRNGPCPAQQLRSETGLGAAGPPPLSAGRPNTVAKKPGLRPGFCSIGTKQ